jgi:RHS repeat-associated protein
MKGPDDNGVRLRERLHGRKPMKSPGVTRSVRRSAARSEIHARTCRKERGRIETIVPAGPRTHFAPAKRRGCDACNEGKRSGLRRSPRNLARLAPGTYTRCAKFGFVSLLSSRTMLLYRLVQQRWCRGLRKGCCHRFHAHVLAPQAPLRNGRTCFEGPFGEVIRATGPMAKANPFRFSTKYQDDETDLLYYGHRYYNASAGRWPSRDPAEGATAGSLYGFVGNDPLDGFDVLGLDAYGEAMGWLTDARRLFRNESVGRIVSFESVLSKLAVALVSVKSVENAPRGEDSWYSSREKKIMISKPAAAPVIRQFPDVGAFLGGLSIGHELTHAYDDILLKVPFRPLDATEGHAHRFSQIASGMAKLAMLNRLLNTIPFEGCAQRERKYSSLWRQAWAELDYARQVKEVPVSDDKTVMMPMTASDHTSFTSAYGLKLSCAAVALHFNLPGKFRCCSQFTCRRYDLSVFSAIGTDRELSPELR